MFETSQAGFAADTPCLLSTFERYYIPRFGTSDYTDCLGVVVRLASEKEIKLPGWFQGHKADFIENAFYLDDFLSQSGLWRNTVNHCPVEGVGATEIEPGP
jgi:hypothetical protein